MTPDTDEFKVFDGETIDLDKRPTRSKPVYDSDDDYDATLRAHAGRLGRLQEMLYASGGHALLIIFQGMDTAGKDGAISHVMSGVNPQGCEVHSFKQPSAEELRHDFLWRAAQRLPERGRIGIFNRSHYEEVLVVRVHPELLANAGLDPASAGQKSFWKERYDSIADFERHLARNGTRIVKFFLHLSKEEQRKRFLDRIDEPEKNWKFGSGDVTERGLWKDYMKAYEECLGATSTPHAPWFVVPADDKKSARLIISRILVETMEDMSLHYPKPGARRAAELRAARKELEEEKLLRD